MSDLTSRKRDSREAIDVVEGAPRVRRVDVGRFRVSDAIFPPGYRIASHFHERAVLSVIVEGRFLQQYPGQDCHCPPGGVIVKPPGERHVDRWYDVRSHHLIVEPDPARHDELGECARMMDEVHHGFDPAARGVAQRIVRELDHRQAATDLAVEALALELMVMTLRGPETGRRDHDPPPWLRRVRDLLHDRYTDDLSLDELAAESGVHRTHLSRAFSRHYAMGIADYLRTIRLRAAQRELAETDDSICDIALRNRFSDQSHLTRTLKSTTGLTPARYRRVHRVPARRKPH